MLGANRITTISYFSKKQVLELAPWARKKITVIYNPVNSILEKKTKKFNSEYPVILHLGTKQNKNLDRTVLALVDIPCKLVIVGILNKEQLEILKMSKIDFENHVNIPFTHIKELYEYCDLVAFISLYEGFGMPIIEAQKVGRAVITSDRSSIPEVANNTALMVDPENIEAIHAGFKKLINDDYFRNQLIEEGFKNVKRFDINNIANQYLELYKKL